MTEAVAPEARPMNDSTTTDGPEARASATVKPELMTWDSRARRVVTLYILVLGAPVQNVVLFYGLPSLLSSLQLFYFGTFRPHRHEEEAFIDRHNARSNQFGYLASLLTCFHFGYHHEHHTQPWVPWWALPSTWREEQGR